MNTPNDILGFPIAEWVHAPACDQWIHWTGVAVYGLSLLRCTSEANDACHAALQRYIDSLAVQECETKRAQQAAYQEALQFCQDLWEWRREHDTVDSSAQTVLSPPQAMMKRYEAACEAMAAWEAWRLHARRYFFLSREENGPVQACIKEGFAIGHR